MTGTRISKLQVLHFRKPLPKPVTTTMGLVMVRPALLLRIEDEEGAEGWGEIWCNFPPGGDYYRAELAVNVLSAVLAEMHCETPQPSTFVHQRLRRLELQSGDTGSIVQLAAGVDIAIHDLRARRRGVPLAVELGGRVRPVPAYASGISPEQNAIQVTRMRALGYRHFKQRIGFGREDSLPELQDTAASLASDEYLMADANQGWDLETAVKRLDQLDTLGLEWLEEPLLADASADEWRQLDGRCTTPLAGGENLRHHDSFLNAIQCGALSVVQPDICKWGGLSGCLAIAQLALERGLRYCPHYLGGGVGLIASAHLLSAVGGDGLLEVDSSDNPLQAALSGGSLALSDGLFHIADAPGLGFVPDITSMSELLVRDTTVRIRT